MAAAAGIAAIVMSNNNKRLRAQSPPGALVAAHDSTAEVREKNYNYGRVVEAVRILNNIVQQDKLVPILFDETRTDVDNFLSEFYNRQT